MQVVGRVRLAAGFFAYQQYSKRIVAGEKRKTELRVEEFQLLPRCVLLRYSSTQCVGRVESQIIHLAPLEIIENRRTQMDVGKLHGRAFGKGPEEGEHARGLLQQDDLIAAHLDGFDQQVVEVFQQQTQIGIPGN